MGVAQDSPQEVFSRFVRRAIDEARAERGWTVAELAAHTGVGRSTVFRWLAGDWQDYPELAKVRGFCTALDLPVPTAFRALGLATSTGEGGADRPDDPVNADIRVLLGRLAAPHVPVGEKKLIRDLIHYLAQRPIQRQDGPPERVTRQAG